MKPTHSLSPSSYHGQGEEEEEEDGREEATSSVLSRSSHEQRRASVRVVRRPVERVKLTIGEMTMECAGKRFPVTIERTVPVDQVAHEVHILMESIAHLVVSHCPADVRMEPLQRGRDDQEEEEGEEEMAATEEGFPVQPSAPLSLDGGEWQHVSEAAADQVHLERVRASCRTHLRVTLPRPATFMEEWRQDKAYCERLVSYALATPLSELIEAMGADYKRSLAEVDSLTCSLQTYASPAERIVQFFAFLGVWGMGKSAAIAPEGHFWLNVERRVCHSGKSFYISFTTAADYLVARRFNPDSEP